MLLSGATPLAQDKRTGHLRVRLPNPHLNTQSRVPPRWRLVSLRGLTSLTHGAQISKSQEATGDNHAVSSLKFRVLRYFLQLGYAVFLSDVDIVTLQVCLLPSQRSKHPLVLSELTRLCSKARGLLPGASQAGPQASVRWKHS